MTYPHGMHGAPPPPDGPPPQGHPPQGHPQQGYYPPQLQAQGHPHAHQAPGGAHVAVVTVLVVVGVLAVIAIPFVVAFSSVGDWLNEQQAELFGGYYYPKLTFAIVLLLCVGVGSAVFKVASAVFGRKKGGA